MLNFVNTYFFIILRQQKIYIMSKLLLFLMILSVNVYGSNTSQNYILDVNQEAITIDVSNYPLGMYTVVLIADGNIVDSINLLKE